MAVFLRLCKTFWVIPLGENSLKKEIRGMASQDI